MIKEYDDIKEEIENLKKSTVHQRSQFIHKTMLSYCLKDRKNTESKNPRVAKTNKGRLIILSKCAVRDSKKLRFIKGKEASSLLINLGEKTPISQIPLVGPLFF